MYDSEGIVDDDGFSLNENILKDWSQYWRTMFNVRSLLYFVVIDFEEELSSLFMHGVLLSLHYLFILICMYSGVKPGFCNLYSLLLLNVLSATVM